MTPRRRQKNPELPACMYHKHGAYWLVKRGKWRRLGEDLRSSLIAYAKLTAPSSGAMGKLIDEAMGEIEGNVAASTRKQYWKAANRLKEMLVEFEPQQVQQADIAAIKRALKKIPNMCNRVLSVARSIFAYAVENQIVQNNPCVGIKRHPETKRTRLITWDEFNRIRAEAAPRMQIIMDLLVTTGQRPIDVIKIRRADIDDAKGIYFKQQKTGNREIVKWTSAMRTAVDRALELQGPVKSLTLFRTRNGGAPAYRTIRDQWDRACDKAKVEDADLRDLRAVAGTEANRQGKSATALLGHSSPSNTKRYLRDREIPEVEGPDVRHLIDSIKK